jgi:hypothetical protein
MSAKRYPEEFKLAAILTKQHKLLLRQTDNLVDASPIKRHLVHVAAKNEICGIIFY